MMSCREKWLNAMIKIADPVLTHLEEGTLRKTMPEIYHPDRAEYMHLEALGRTLCGMSPWLEAEGMTGEEGKLQQTYRDKARKAIANAVNPASEDYMNFSEGYGQSLADAAFLAHAIIRAPKQLYFLLDDITKEQLAVALWATRKFKAGLCNWLFFSAMVEAALYVMKLEYRKEPVKKAVQMFESWYLGDGVYGDGEPFHWDYYNSFVIHPMYLDVLRTFKGIFPDFEGLLTACERRAGRYAAVLERMIGTDGTYPILGRSVTYRFGAFQLLSQAAVQKFLPDEVKAAQVRCALTAVIEKCLEAPGTFDKDGWLQPGVYGCQPGLAEGYISTGSLYLCETVFLPLGLGPNDPFWAGPDEPWTAVKIWSSLDLPCDHAL